MEDVVATAEVDDICPAVRFIYGIVAVSRVDEVVGGGVEYQVVLERLGFAVVDEVAPSVMLNIAVFIQRGFEVAVDGVGGDGVTHAVEYGLLGSKRGGEGRLRGGEDGGEGVLGGGF